MKLRCTGCGEYFDKAAFLVTAPGNNACSAECLGDIRERRRPKQRAKPKIVRIKPIPPDVRAEVLERDGRRCRGCGKSDLRHLHVHHIRYRSEGGKHISSNLVSLCQDCHALVHSNKRRYQPLLLAVLEAHLVHDNYTTVRQLERWRSSSDASSSESRGGDLGRDMDDSRRHGCEAQ